MNHIKGLSLFSNVGVAEAYLKEIGVDILIANEIDELRAKFYQEIYKDTHVICGDITDGSVRASRVLIFASDGESINVPSPITGQVIPLFNLIVCIVYLLSFRA